MKKLLCFLAGISFVCMAQSPPAFTATVNGAPAGYYFISAYKGPLVSWPMILDEAGHMVYYKKVSNSNSGDFRVWPDGRMSYFMSSASQFMIFDSTFNVIDSVVSVGYGTNAHELQILPNGHYLLLGYENTTQDLSAYPYFNHNGTYGSTTASVKSDIVQELDASKNLVFDWHLKNYFPFTETDPYFLAGPNVVDWSHANALELDQDGNILMSTRQFSEITKINRTNGNVMWHFGGNNNQFTFLTDTTRFYGQHDIRRLPNGNITLYDDGDHNIPHGSRGVEYELDEINMTAKLVWSYNYDPLMHSNAMGGVQVLPDKSAIIDYGITNKDSVCFSMVDSLGTEIYKIKFNQGQYSYRTHYYPALPWQLHRPTISCHDSLGTFYLKVDSAYGSYLWSNGSTNSAIAITSTGTYYVYVPYGPNGHVSSYPLTITNLNMQCGSTTAINDLNDARNYKLFPNPAQNQVTISSPAFNEQIVLTIKDVYGKNIALPATTHESSYTFDISSLAAGMYFICTPNKTLRFVKGKD